MTKRTRTIRDMQHAKAGDIRHVRNYRDPRVRMVICESRAIRALHPEWMD
ncbi:hypothetical protein J3S85_37610 [Streptomyces lavenduligriseus]|nr:hypothetical protein J3S85_37610 [Streptomyces lavenduligriseus]